MPMKLVKTENENELTVEQILHAKRYSLVLDRTRCAGCGMCKEICPREAIELRTTPKTNSEDKPVLVDVDEKRCHYCGMCSAICPFGAVTVKINGETAIPVVNSESFPQLIREITVDTTQCPLDCTECEKACPLELVKVTGPTDSTKTSVQPRRGVKAKENQVSVEIERDFCPCCRLCDLNCPEGALRVQKIFHGVININREKCPEGCQDCLDACPIPGALYLDEDKKVHVNEVYCVYCGVCKIVCPEEDALHFQRTYVRHTPVHSGAWNKALEKLTSTKGMTKELKAISSKKIRESVRKRFEAGGT